MRNTITYLIFFFTALSIQSQNTVLCRVSPEKKTTIQVKWYCPALINLEGFYVYRKESSIGTWERLNVKPIAFKTFQIPEEEFNKDKELKSYLELASTPSNIKDLALLAVLIKSFKSDAFSNYLGIRYDDTSFEQGKEYEYKITSILNSTENEFEISKKIKAENYRPINPPKNNSIKTGNKKVSFRWDPEPNAYFGVHIYRKISDTGQFHRITKDPIILSKTKNAKGEEVYGDEFYVDGKLKPHINYYYQLEALDFFGSPSVRSNPILVVLKDLDPPKSPDTLYNSLNGKNVGLKWKKKKREEDLLGYNIYRTTKNDTDFKKINKEILSVNDSVFIDRVPAFSSYMYAVSCVDKDENETISNPFHIEVFDNEPPMKPENLTIQADSGKLILRWNKNNEEDLKGYLVYRTINKNSEDTYVKMTPTPFSENIYTDILPKNIKNKFLYKVVAVDLSLNRSLYSEFALARMPDVIAPNAPFLKTISTTLKKQILIEWFSNAEPDLAGYSIYRKNIYDTSSSFKKLNVKQLDRNTFRYTDRYGEEGALYAYYLIATDSSGNASQNSNILKSKLKKTEEEEKITITQFDARYNENKKQVILKWKLKHNEEFKGSVVYKLKPGETVFSPISGTTDEEDLADKDVSAGSDYIYQLRVYDLRGDVYRSEKITLSIK